MERICANFPIPCYFCAWILCFCGCSLGLRGNGGLIWFPQCLFARLLHDFVILISSYVWPGLIISGSDIQRSSFWVNLAASCLYWWGIILLSDSEIWGQTINKWWPTYLRITDCLIFHTSNPLLFTRSFSYVLTPQPGSLETGWREGHRVLLWFAGTGSQRLTIGYKGIPVPELPIKTRDLFICWTILKPLKSRISWFMPSKK